MHIIDTNKKVAIVGFASSSRMLAPFAPYGRNGWEIWGLNSLYAVIPPDCWTRWFEIHPREHFIKDLNRSELKQVGLTHYDWLKKQPGPGQEGFRPIYTQQHYPEIPASVKWPREEINEWTRRTFGESAELDYFTSTPAEMIVQAIMEGFGRIDIFGVDLCEDGEYAYQRPGMEYWIGVARGMGIQVNVPPSSALCKASYVYGYTEPPCDYGALEPLATFFDEQNKKLERQQTEIAALVNTYSGAKQAFDTVVGVIEGNPPKDLVASVVAILQAPRKEGVSEEADKLERVIAMCKDRLAVMNAQLALGSEALKKIEGTREGFASSVVYTKHFGRGGKLEGQVNWHQVKPPTKYKKYGDHDSVEQLLETEEKAS